MEIHFTVSGAARGAALMLSLALASCGGGGVDSSAGSGTGGSLVFSGTAAIGDALVGRTVSASCASGSVTQSAPTTASGGYTLTVTAALPCTLSVVEPQSGITLRALAVNAGTVNITPLTEALYVFSNGDPARLPVAATQLGTLMEAIGSPLTSDPLATPFAPDGTGLDRNILDLTAAISNRNLQAPATGPGALAELPAALTQISTTCSTGTRRCMANQVLLASITTEAVRSFGESLFEELDSQVFGSAFTALYGSSVDPALESSIERGTKYALALMLKKFGKDVLAQSGLSRDTAQKVVKKLATAYRKDSTRSVFSLPRVKKGDIVELFVSAAVNAFIETLEELTMPNVALDGSWSDAFESVVWGAGAFSSEVVANTALFCSSTPAICKSSSGLQLVTLLNEVEATASWIVKDALLLRDIWTLTNEVSESNRRNAVMEELLRQFRLANDPFSNGAYTWATSGGMADSLSYTVSVALEQARASVDLTIPTDFEPSWRDQIRLQQLARIDRQFLRWGLIEQSCRSLFAGQREVGVSKCLNLMRVSPAAPLSCTDGTVLRWGACGSAAPSLPAGIWAITGVDAGGTSWEGSTLTIESQMLDGANRVLSGYFDWVSNSGSYGRENFSGTLYSNRHFAVRGNTLVQPALGLITNVDYTANLAPSGQQFVDGTWSGAGGVNSTNWSATLGAVVLKETDTSQWRLRMTVTRVNAAGTHGSFAFSKLRCGGALVYQGKTVDGRYRFQEDLTYGNCIRGCEIQLDADVAGYTEVCKSGVAYRGVFMAPRPSVEALDALLGQ